MAVHQVDLADLAGAESGMSQPAWAIPGGPNVVLVDVDQPAPPGHLATLPAVVVGLTAHTAGQTGNGTGGRQGAEAWCDVLLGPDDAALDALCVTVESRPLAATALAVLLRGSHRRSVADGLLAESAVYSALLAGPEFAAWRTARLRRQRPATVDPVVVERHGATLTVTLHRPEVRNALNTAMRDALVEAMRLAAADPSITQVVLRGSGVDFCSGGDLDEFGAFADPVSAHLVRVRQSAGAAVHAVAQRVTARLHGACVGSGIEIPAFAARVVAAPDVRIALPEVSLGLIPGAGGTVSLPQRIGRHWTARLALTGERLDGATALAIGLVDECERADDRPLA